MRSGTRWGRRVAVLAVTTAALAASGAIVGVQPAAAAVCSTRWEQGNAASSLCTPVINLMQHRVWIDCHTGTKIVRVYGPWKPYGTRSYASCFLEFDWAKGFQTRSLSCGPEVQAAMRDGAPTVSASRDESVNC